MRIKGTLTYRILVGCVSMILVATSTGTHAQQDQQQENQYQFEVGGFSIHGDNPLGESTAQKILAPYLHRQLDVVELRQAAESLEQSLAKKGYNFHRVSLPAQKLKSGQTIQLDVDALSLGQVQTTGNEWFSDRNIVASMPILKPGETPNSIAVSNALALAKENPAKDVHVVFVRGEFPGTVDARISVSDVDPHDLLIWANNSGSDLASRSRMGLQYSHRNLWGRDHNVSLSYSLSPEDTDELTQWGVNYSAPLYALRSKANLFYSNSDADSGRVADVFDVSGSGETYGFSIARMLNKRGKLQHQLGFDIVDKLFVSDIAFEGTDIGADVRSRPASIFYDWNWLEGQWGLAGNLAWFENLSGGTLNTDAAYESAKAGAERDWQRLNAALDVTYTLSDVWRFAARVRAQESDDRLISGEQFGMGGVLGGAGPRGFLEREVATDKGTAGSIEAWRRFPVRKLDVGIFMDWASGRNNRPLASEQTRQSLSSIGASLRWNLRSDLRLDVDYGYVLSGIEGSVDQGTLDDDSRWHLSLRYFPNIGGRR